MESVLHFIEHNEAIWWILGVLTTAGVLMFPIHTWQKKQPWYEGTHTK